MSHGDKMSFFRYPGGKTKLAKIIVSKLSDLSFKNNLTEYREPFFGGGSIGINFIQSEHPKSVWINDKDIGIACLWSAIIKDRASFKQFVMNFKPTVASFYKFKNDLLSIQKMPTDLNAVIETGFKKFAIHQISYSGLGTKSGGPLGGADQKSQYKIDCRWSPNHVCKKIDKVFALLSKLQIQQNACTNFDFASIIRDESKQALLYLDPPYYIKGNDLYQKGFTTEDHERLSGLLRATKHRWLLSYDDCPEVRKIYSWAKIDSIDVNYTITGTKDKDTGKRLARTKPELLISAL